MSSIVGALRVNLGLDSAQFIKGAKEAQTTSQRLGKSMQKIGAAVSAVGAGIAYVVQGQLRAASEMSVLANVANTGVVQFQRFAEAASTVGINSEKLSDILKDVSDRVGDFLTTGGGPMADFFENVAPLVGVTAEQFRDLSGADALQLYVSSLEAANLSQSEMTFYLEAMASDTTALIPLLRNGGEELNRLGDAAERAGVVMSDDAVAAARDFSLSMAELGQAARGLAVIVTAELAPFLARLAEIAASAVSAFQGMSPIMRDVVAAIAALTVVAGPVIIGLGTLLITGKALLAPFAGIAALLAGAVKAAFVGLAVVVGAVGLPVTLLIAGVAALTAGVIAFWPEIKQLTAAFLDLADRGINYAKEKLDELLQFVSGLGARMFEAGSNVMKGLGDGIKAGASGAWSGIKGSFDRVLDYLPGRAEIRSPSRLFARFGRFIMDGLGLGIQEGSARPVSAMQGVTDQMATQVGGASGRISGMFENAFVGIVTGTMKAKDAIASLLQDLAKLLAQQAFRSLFGGLFGGETGGGFLSSIFGGFRADGGPVASGRSYIVGERGPELFTPGASGQITSNENMLAGGSAPVVNISIDARGAVEGVAAQINAAITQRVPEIVRAASGYSSDRALRGYGA